MSLCTFLLNSSSSFAVSAALRLPSRQARTPEPQQPTAHALAHVLWLQQGKTAARASLQQSKTPFRRHWLELSWVTRAPQVLWVFLHFGRLVVICAGLGGSCSSSVLARTARKQLSFHFFVLPFLSFFSFFAFASFLTASAS